MCGIYVTIDRGRGGNEENEFEVVFENLVNSFRKGFKEVRFIHTTYY